MGNLLSFTDNATSNALFSGNEQFCYATDIKISGSNIIKEVNKTAQPTFTSADGTGTDKYQKAYNRKKMVSQQTSFKSPNISFKILLPYAEKDITSKTINGSVVEMLTLHKLYHMIRSPRTYYLKETTLMSQFYGGDYDYYTASGIPVVIKEWDIELENNGKGNVIVSITLVEDYDSLVG